MEIKLKVLDLVVKEIKRYISDAGVLMLINSLSLIIHYHQYFQSLGGGVERTRNNYWKELNAIEVLGVF